MLTHLLITFEIKWYDHIDVYGLGQRAFKKSIFSKDILWRLDRELLVQDWRNKKESKFFSGGLNLKFWFSLHLYYHDEFCDNSNFIAYQVSKNFDQNVLIFMLLSIIKWPCIYSRQVTKSRKFFQNMPSIHSVSMYAPCACWGKYKVWWKFVPPPE